MFKVKPIKSQFLSGYGRPVALLSVAFLFVAFWTPLGSLVAAWQNQEYSHSYFIPILALLLGAHRLADMKPKIAASWIGVWVLAGAGILFLIGRLSAFEPLDHYAFLVTLVGLSLSVLGREASRVLIPAFAYLMFAIPLPRLIFVMLSQDLQLLSSTIGVGLLTSVGVPVYQEGNIIDLGGAKLQVAEACSGLRYLFPLMSFGFLMACLLESAFWKKLALFLSTLPIAIAINSLRIAIIGITVNFWGDDMAKGLLHDFEGWTMFVICLFLLAGEIWAFRSLGTAVRVRYEYAGIPNLKFMRGKIPASPPVLAALLVCFLLACVFATGIVDRRKEIIPSHPPFSSFPLRFGEWSGREQSLPPDALDELKLSDYWLADYRQDKSGAEVNLYIAYYDSQHTQGSAHSPANCIVGSGWQVEKKQTYFIPLAFVPLGKNAPIEVSRLVIRRDAEAQLVYYWFDERGRAITEQYGAKWYLFWDSVFMHRTDGALVRLTTNLGQAESEDAASARLNEFFLDAYPQIRNFVPAEKALNGASY